MEQERPKIDDLYIKKLTGTLSSTEEAHLDERLKSDPDKKKDFEVYQNLWESSSRLPLEKGLTKDERWNKLNQRIQQDSPHAISKYKIVLRYAAMISIIATAVGLYFFLNIAAPIEIKTAFGETKTIVLPDQSTVKLNAGTILTYDPSEWGTERIIYLDGEAYFNVTHNGAPFTVSSHKAIVKVLGTTFNIRSRDQVTTVVCTSGKVSFGKATGIQGVVLTKGTGATLSGTVLSSVYKVANEEGVPWITGDLSFNNTALSEIFLEIERRFNVSIVVKKDIGRLTFTGKFKNPQLETVIKTVCLSAGLKYSMKKNSITIE